MKLKKIKISEQHTGNQYCFDSQQNQFIVTNDDQFYLVDLLSQQQQNIQIYQSPTVQTLKKQYKQCQSSPDQEEHKSDDNQHKDMNITTMRFMPSQAQSKLLISPTGLVITSRSQTEEIAIANQGFSEGTYYWEIICPLSCADIRVGVMSEGWDLKQTPKINKNFQQKFVFNTSTPRIIGIKLDLIKNQLLTWLNGNLLNDRTKSLKPGTTYYPFVEILSNGNHVILNPYAQEPQKQYNLFPLQDNQLYQTYDNEFLNKINLIKQLQNKVQVNTNLFAKSDGQTQIFYLPNNQNYLLKRGNALKLVRKGNHVRAFQTAFLNRPIKVTDQIYLDIDLINLKLLITQISWKKLSNGACVQVLCESIQEALQRVQESDHVLLKLAYFDAKKSINALLSYILDLIDRTKQPINNIKKQKEQLNVDEQSALPFSIDEEVHVSSEEEVKEDDTSFSLLYKQETLINLLRIILTLDEQLFAMIQHEDASQDLKQLFSSQMSRLYTAFCRLGSLLNFPTYPYNLVDLAESGVYNAQDFLYKARHFLDNTKDLQQINSQNTSKSLEKSLREQLPENRMVNGLVTHNVDLATTINNLPHAYHETQTLEFNIKSVHIDPNSNYVTTVSDDGRVTVWNTELGLIKVLSNNFKMDLQQDDKKIEKENLDIDSFLVLEDTLKAKNVNDSYVSMEDEGEEEEEEIVTPDESLVEQMYLMGFPVDLARKALIKTKNQGISQALDIIQTLIEEEKKTDNKDVKQNTTLLKPDYKWNCDQCTFFNQNGNDKCEICFKSAPMEAFYTQTELEQLEAEKNAMKVIETNQKIDEEKNRQLLLEEQAKQQKIDAINKSKIVSDFMYCLKDSPRNPVMVGMLLSQSDKFLLKLRRLGYKNTFIQRYVNQMNLSTEQICVLDNKFLTIKNDQNSIIDESLFGQEHRFQIEALEPLFIGNQRYSSSASMQNEQFNADWQILDELEINVECKKVLGCCVGNVESIKKELEFEYFDIYILVVDLQGQVKLIVNNMQISKYKACVDVNSIQNTLTLERDIAQIQQDKPIAMIFMNDMIYIGNGQSLFILKGNQCNLVDTIELNFDVVDIKLLDKNHLLVQGEKQKEIFELNNLQNMSNESKQQQSNTINQTLSPNTMTSEQITNLKNIMETHSVGCTPSPSNSIVSLKDPNNGLHSKHYWINTGKQYEIKFDKPENILSFTTELFFEQKFAHTNQDQLTLQQEADKKNLSSLTQSDQTIVNSSQNYLPLRIVSFEGACYNYNMFVTRMLYPKEKEVFVTNYPNSEFVFEHLHQKTMVIQSVQISSDFKPCSGGYPMGSGLVFTANHQSFFKMTQKFNRMSLEQYKTWLQDKKDTCKDGFLTFEYWEPVGFFYFDKKSQKVNIELECKRPTKYFFLKPCNMRQEPNSYTSFFETQPMEISFISVKGYTVEQKDVQEQMQNIPSTNVPQSIMDKIKVEANVNGQWTAVSNDSFKANVSQFPYGQSEIEENSNVLSHKLTLISKETNQSDIKGLRITLAEEQNNENFFVSLSLQACIEEKQSSSFNQFRKLLLDDTQYEKLVQNFVKLMTNEKESQDKRVAIVSLLTFLMHKQPKLIEKIYKDLDLHAFVVNNVLQDEFNYFQEYFDFLKSLIQLQVFSHHILQVLLKILPNLTELQQTFDGLNGYFSLMEWCRNIDQNSTFVEVLHQLNVMGQKIKANRQPEYNLLRTQFNISSLAFEKSMFSYENLTYPHDNLTIEYQKKEVKQPLKSKFLSKTTSYGRQLVINLQEYSSIDEIQLSIQKNSQICKLRVQIYAILKDESSVNGYRENLIYTNIYSESQWIQLSQYAYDRANQKNYFDEDFPLQTLGISDLNSEAKYISIQVSHGLQPQYKVPIQPTCVIIPQVFGSKLENSMDNDIKDFESMFCIEKEFLQSDTVVQVSGPAYKVQEYKVKNNEIKFFENQEENNEQNAQNDQKAPQQELGNIKESLQILQTELSDKLYVYRGQQTSSYQQEINDLCLKIEQIQVQIYKRETKKPQQNLDYMISLSKKLSKFLRKIDDSEEKIWRSNEMLKNEEGTAYILSLFENMILQDLVSQDINIKSASIDTLPKEILQLITQVLVDNVVEREWQHFVVQVIRKFLSKPIMQTLEPINNLFSQPRILEALDVISVPNGEIIAYLAQKLSIELIPNEIIFQKSSFNIKSKNNEVKRNELFSMATILVLLNSGFQKYPVTVFDPRQIVHKGSYCFNCGQNKHLVIHGTRYKCLNCPNLDCCEAEECQRKHLQFHSNHSFIIIEEPLPLAPELQTIKNPSALAQPFVLQEPLSIEHGIDCDKCQKKISGNRFMCANCEDYSLCSKCHQAGAGHSKYHVFVKILYKLKQSESTPKCLFQVLDPLLYPMKLLTTIDVSQSPRKLTNRLKRQISGESDGSENGLIIDKKLVPLNVKRSLSQPSQIKQMQKTTMLDKVIPIVEEDEFVELPRQDHEDSLRIAFGICYWICEYSDFSDLDKINMLSLTLDLVLSLTKLCSVSGIRQLLRSHNQFLNIFLNILQLNSSQLTEKLRLFLNQLASLKTVSVQDESNLNATEIQKITNEKTALEEAKLLLLFHLKTILQWTLDFALNPQQQSLYSTIFHNNNPNLWLEHTAFLLEFLLSASDKINLEVKDSDSKMLQKKTSTRRTSKGVPSNEFNASESQQILPPLGISRSLSTSVYPVQMQSMQNVSIENCEKSTALQINRVYDLISLLTPNYKSRQSYSFQNSLKMWSLVLKAILQVKISSLIESNIFDKLIQSFLQVGQEIQQSIFPEILKLTQNIIGQTSHQKEFCNVLLNVMFSLVDQSMLTSNPIFFSLLKGWLDILITKTTPKLDGYYIKPLDSSFCKLNAVGALNLLSNLAKFMSKHINFGGQDGALMASEMSVLKLELADDMMRVLIYSESSSGVYSLSELFNNSTSYTVEIQSALSRLIDWYLLNKITETNNSPSTNLMLSISDNVWKLFQLTIEHEEIQKLCISILINSCKTIDDMILKLHRSSSLSNYTGLQFNTKNCEILEKLFEFWITSDSLASYAAFDVKGFEYLLDRMGINEGQFGDKEQIMESSLISGTSLLEYLNTKQYSKKEIINQQEESLPQEQDFKEEEFASKVDIVNQPGQVLQGVVAGQDWSANRKGARARVVHFEMNNKNYNEFNLVIELKRQVEPKQIKVGFNTVWTDYNNKVLGVPSSVLIEGGQRLTDMVPLGQLEMINDEGYSNYSVKVFKKNFQQINSQTGTLEDSLKSLSNTKIKFIKFKIRRPIVTFIENLSFLNGKPYRSVAISISFLSIVGHDPLKVNSLQQIISNQKDSALRVIGKLCNPQYTDMLKILANKTNIVEKFKGSFEVLSNLLTTQENWLSPVFLAIASYNPEMGDWLLEQLLDFKRSQPHAKMVLQIIQSDQEKSFSRIQKLYSFLSKNIMLMCSTVGNNLLQSTVFISFMEALCTSIRMYNYSGQDNTLLFSQEHVDAILQLYSKQLSNTVISHALTKLLITLLYLPKEIKSEQTGLLKYTLNKIWERIQNKEHNFLALMAPIIAGSDIASEWMLSNKVLAKLMTDIENLMINYQKSQCKELHNYMIAVNGALCRDYTVRQYIIQNEWHIKMYNSLKAPKESKSILKDFDKYFLELVFQFFKLSILGFPKSEKKLAQILKDDLVLLESKRDLTYVTKLLVPLLNAELDIPVCIHMYDSQQNKFLSDSQNISKNAKKTITQNSFNSNIFSNKQKEAFLSTLDSITSTTFLNQKLKKSSWQLITTQTEDSNLALKKTIEQNVLKAGPFAIIIEGTNAGKYAVAGVFSSQILSDEEANEYSYEVIYNIPHSDDCFIFYYDEDNNYHFNVPYYSSQSAFGQYHESEDGGCGISFYYNGSERIFIPFQSNSTTYIDINVPEMVPYNPKKTDTFVNKEIPADFVFKKAEYWVLKTTPTPTVPDKLNNANMQTKKSLCPSWVEPNSPLNYYRASPLYFVPSQLNVEQISNQFFNNQVELKSYISNEVINEKTSLLDLGEFVAGQPESHNIIDLYYDIQNFEGQLNEKLPNFAPNMSIFNQFELEGGVQQIIEVLLKSLTLWKNKDRSQKWFTWIKELASFSSIPHFFGLFIKNQVCIDLLFKILAGAPDQDKPTKESNLFWEEEEQKAVKYSYQIIADVFRVDSEGKTRDFAIENQLIERLLDRLSIISKEEKRTFQEDKEESESEEEIIQEKKEEMKEEDYKLKVVKKKGVGYASDNTGQNQKWNVSEYQASTKVKNEQIQSLLTILNTFLDFPKWTPPEKLIKILLSSSMLPLLEAAFRSSSLLDMSKHSELYLSYLYITKVLCQHKSLLPCILPIDQRYLPRQTESIIQLLKSLKELAKIFMRVHQTTNQDAAVANQVTYKLAEQIIETHDYAEQAIQNLDQDSDYEDNTQDILQLPLAEKYKLLLKDLRFDYMSIQNESNGKYVHHYQSHIVSNSTPPQEKMLRLAQELADLSTALPIEHTNSIFVRCDSSRVDVMKALIMGASGTPYAHGAFEFDIFFDDIYPNGPPKVNLQTTGAGKTRFNPNLYSCGKVCLSLLGTWRGNASENWDPKLSTLLQVLVSIQAIIMSEEVYFNEPGFEGEAGTEEGEKKNEAYANIVRYSNIMFAMIDQIKNPSKGFETVIKRHFYLKKDEILEEANKWLKFADVRPASYVGLINDHNSQWCQKFKKDSRSYYNMLKDAVKELTTELNNLPVPSLKDMKLQSHKKKDKKHQKNINVNDGAQNLDDVDVTYEQTISHKELDFNSDEVKDRWSRYIGAMGMEAVAKQASASVFLSGVGAFGIEIAKNIVLSGVKRFTIHDSKVTKQTDLSGQFFLDQSNVGQNRAKACLNKIQQLNNYVKVDCADEKALELTEEYLDSIALNKYTLVILSECDYKTQIFVNNYCRKNNVKFLITEVQGAFSKLFVDLGKDFEVVDKNGEEIHELMIKSITNEEKAKVCLLPGAKHGLEDGDYIIFNNVLGMELEDKERLKELTLSPDYKGELKSINGTLHKITVINANSFSIGDTTMFKPYDRDGLCKQIKLPVKLQFDTFENTYKNKVIPFDEQMQYHDYLKIESQQILHIAFETLDLFQGKHKRYPVSWNYKDMIEFEALSIELAKNVYEKFEDIETTFLQVIRQFALTAEGVFPPLAAFIGGFVSQEIIKAITQKYIPVKQYVYIDCQEVIPELPEDSKEIENFVSEKVINKKVNNRYDSLRNVIGDTLFEDVKYTKLFMVGAGAIGCELLKNFAMIGLGTGTATQEKKAGQITLTDPDVIETSNLNRQFLFREKHIRKAKSTTAAAASIQMNPDLKGHVVSRLDKVHDGTAHIFTDNFFENLTIVANALDNVQARRYVDMRCVSAKVPLLESGTLGPKGHVQVILPYKTESYGSQADPGEEGEIPHCTLKMFPEETLHCVEWARDKFSKIFNQRPKALCKILEEKQVQIINNQELKVVNEVISLLKKSPKDFADCIKYARLKFQKYFVNDIRQLMYTYPLDAKTKEGSPFWSLPKRPPVEITFDPKNKLHVSLVSAIACLRAVIFKIKLPDNPRAEETKQNIADQAFKVDVPDYKPSDEKSKEINSQLESQNKDKQEEKQEQEEEEQLQTNEFEIAINDVQALIKGMEKDAVQAEEFEKDVDSNFHIDFIYSLANCRSSNYKLDPMDWLTVKIKAGRIIPALATTTAAISGLQTIELVKILKNCKVDTMKNAFLNLAVPILQLSEPGAAPKIQLHKDLEVNIWDRWDVKFNKTKTININNLFEYLNSTYKMYPKDVIYKSTPVYFSAIYNAPGKEKEKAALMEKKIKDILELDKSEKYVDLTVTFTLEDDKGDIIKGTPMIRLYFDQSE